MSVRILIIEDETTLARNIKQFLECSEFEVAIAMSGEKGLDMFEKFEPDMVLLDYQLPGLNGLKILRKLRMLDPNIKVIFITAHGNVEVAVDAMKTGAYDFRTKPIVLSDLKILLDKALGYDRLRGTLSYYQQREAKHSGLSEMLGKSLAMMDLKTRIERIIQCDRVAGKSTPASVLITGETGSGKELVARALHFEGPRSTSPFVELNCATIPNQLIESELFGFERGAFTDARERKPGLVETANDGTLFLDEIGDMDLKVQAKVLELLEEKVIRRLGSVRERSVDVRIIAATNRSLEELIQAGEFRSDLFFRLRVVSLEIPPLRDRGEDISILAHNFLKKIGKKYGKLELRFSAVAEQALLEYSWPGNIRELRGIVEQAVILAEGKQIEIEQLSLSHAIATTGSEIPGGTQNEAQQFVLPSCGLKLEDVEKNLVRQALEKSSWNLTAAADLLGMTRDTMRYRVEKFGLSQS